MTMPKRPHESNSFLLFDIIFLVQRVSSCKRKAELICYLLWQFLLIKELFQWPEYMKKCWILWMLTHTVRVWSALQFWILCWTFKECFEQLTSFFLLFSCRNGSSVQFYGLLHLFCLLGRAKQKMWIRKIANCLFL